MVHGDTSVTVRGQAVRFLKPALADAASGKTTSEWLEEFNRTTMFLKDVGLDKRLELLTVYFLARVMHRARSFIISKTPEFDEEKGDRCWVNMAVPVAHAEEVNVARSFERCLRCAWAIARDPDLVHSSVDRIANAIWNFKDKGGDVGCYIYPEVSANLQSYIKSRAGSDGLYLFADIGAATVDLSVFVYYTHPTNDRPISYVSAGVIPLGAAQIEIRAARELSRDSPEEFAALQERIQKIKEGVSSGDSSLLNAMRVAENTIENDLFLAAAPVLDNARRKILKSQWQKLRILLGGGGAEIALYRRALDRWFNRFSFFEPELAAIPLPPDLQWPSGGNEDNRPRIFRRFSVAYGLSFDRANLEEHRFPSEVPPLPVDTEPPPPRPQAPSKEEC